MNDTPANNSPNSNPPQSSEPRGNSTKEKVVVAGALVGGLIFFGFMTGTCSNPLSRLSADTINDDQLNIRSSANTKNEVLRADNTTLQRQLDNVYDENSELKQTIVKFEKIQQKNMALRAELDDSIRKQKKISARLAEYAEFSETGRYSDTNSATRNLHQTNLDLQKRIAMLRAQANASAALEKSLIELKANNNALNREINEANARLNRPGTDSIETEADELTASDKSQELNAMIKDLSKQNATLEANLNIKEANIQDIEQLTANLRENERANNKQIEMLTATINQLKAKNNVFVKSADDLPDSARALYTDIISLEGKSADDISSAYEAISEEHNAVAKSRIQFPSGKSELSEDDIAKIQQLTTAAGENSYFLVVGFADQSGSEASNEKLSSDRSTAVAKQITVSAKGLQAAQAVYLGQTSRFGEPEDNRVVEIWQIK